MCVPAVLSGSQHSTAQHGISAHAATVPTGLVQARASQSINHPSSFSQQMISFLHKNFSGGLEKLLGKCSISVPNTYNKESKESLFEIKVRYRDH